MFYAVFMEIEKTEIPGNDPEKSFSEVVKDFRNKKGWTWVELSKRSEIPLKTLEQWGSGKATPPPWNQKTIINYLEGIE